jgi:hypothetical protein
MVPELQGSGADIRLCLISGGKRENEGRSLCPMMTNPVEKGVHRSEEYLHKRNRQRAKRTVG